MASSRVAPQEFDPVPAVFVRDGFFVSCPKKNFSRRT